MKLMPSTRFGVLWRALVACIVVVGCAAGAATTTALLQVKNVVQDFNVNKALTGVDKHLVLPAPGAPETLFLIGADCRYGSCKGSSIGNTDTMMLMRIDSTSTTINVLSIPRDLKVDVPGHGYEKINAAYAEGGPDLLLQTLQQQVFPGLLVTHVMVVDFTGFADLINKVGCVYADVDHRYYNNTAQTDFSSIDIQPGYQKLCGGSGSNLGGPNTALAFVRFRHNDSDIVREARQQDFLRWAKQGKSTSTLLSNESTLVKDFTASVQTDDRLHSTGDIIDLFKLAINANGSTIKSIPFPVAGSGESSLIGDYLTFDPNQTKVAYSKFMTPTLKKAATPPPVRKHHKKKGRHAKKPPPPAVPAGLRVDPGDGLSQAGQVGHPGLPVYYPKYIVEDSDYCFAFTGNCRVPPNDPSEYDNSYPRHYVIRDGGKTYPSYVFTLLISMDAGEYYTVQGTTWQDPPILADPSSVRVVRHRKLDLYSQGGQVTLVAWHTKKAVYWISNTLENQISNPEMVGMAASLARASA
jgi:polyisoprenyl-teichoic acid--peptidoglycan teichoic acid transferase